MARGATLLIAATALLASGVIASAEAMDTLKQIANRGTIRMGFRTDAPPFAFLDDKKEPRGYSIDLCNAIAARVAVTLKRPDLSRKFIPVTAKTRFDDVRKGRVDIECGISTVTLKRRAEVDFTNFTFITGGAFMLRKGRHADTLLDLKRKRIAVPARTTTEAALGEALAKAEISADIVPVDSIDAGLEALTTKKVDAFAEDRMVLLGLAFTKGLKDQVALPPALFSYEPYAFPVRRGDTEFRRVADTALADLYRSGAIWEIYEKWIGALGAKPNDALEHVFALQAVPD